MEVVKFEKEHIKQAREIVISNYNEEKGHITVLPHVNTFPDLECFVTNELGVAALDGDKVIGFCAVMNRGIMLLTLWQRGSFRQYSSMVQ